jgi:hypothetical protein
MHKADKDTEAGLPPSPELIAEMGKLMGEMSRAGVLLAGEGLQPSSKSVRLTFSEGLRTVTYGPLHGSNELLQGFAIVRLNSVDEAIEGASRFGGAVGDADLEIGQVKEPWDLGLCPKPEGLGTRFMIMHKADQNSEAGVVAAFPETSLMGALTREIAKAGVLLSSERLQPSSKGARLKFSAGRTRIIDGPFTESKELIGGYCIIQADTKGDVIEWAIRFAQLLASSKVNCEVELDIVPLYERSDTIGFLKDSQR